MRDSCRPGRSLVLVRHTPIVTAHVLLGVTLPRLQALLLVIYLGTANKGATSCEVFWSVAFGLKSLGDLHVLIYIYIPHYTIL